MTPYGATLGPLYRIAPDFELWEFSGWQTASRDQIRHLEELGRDVLQPMRDRFGLVDVTSWLRDWGSGVHKTGRAVDFVVRGVPMPIAFEWARAQPLRVGELIDERDHIHATTWGTAGDFHQFLLEPTEGVYVAPGDQPGVPWRPPSSWFEIPGIDVVVSRRAGWVVVGALALLLLDMERGRTRSRR